MGGTLTGGSVRILWDATDSASVTITGGSSSWTVGGSPVTFPYTLTASTTFETVNPGDYTVSVEHHGIEVANTPDGTRSVSLRFGEQVVFAPTPDGNPGNQQLANLGATFARRAGTLQPAVRAFMSKLVHGVQPGSLLVQGDSTGNGADEWFRLSLAWLATEFPAYTVTHRLWNDTKQGYDDPSIVQVGTAGVRRIVTTGVNTDRFCTVPDSAATSITGDLDVRVRVKLATIAPTGDFALAGKFGGAGNRSWRLELMTTGALYFDTSADGTNLSDSGTRASSVAVPSALVGQWAWIRATIDVDNGASGRTIRYYYSTENEPTAWTQIGSDRVESGATSIFDSTQTTQLVGRGGAAQNNTGGAHEFAALRVYSGLTGANASVVDIDMAAHNGYASTFTDFAGNTVTVGGTTGTISGAMGLAAFNASTSGQTISYSNDGTRFTKQTPHPADLAYISYGHNEGSNVAYRAAYKTLADALIAKWPDVGIVAVLQSPRKSPAANITEHVIRIEQIHALANAQGYSVVDAYRAILDTGDPDTYVQSDGIHPTTDGSLLWRDAATALLSAWD